MSDKQQMSLKTEPSVSGMLTVSERTLELLNALFASVEDLGDFVTRFNERFKDIEINRVRHGAPIITKLSEAVHRKEMLREHFRAFNTSAAAHGIMATAPLTFHLDLCGAEIEFLHRVSRAEWFAYNQTFPTTLSDAEMRWIFDELNKWERTGEQQ